MEKKLINLLKNVRENVLEVLDDEDYILYEFEVIPIDSTVNDTSTPRITVSTKKLVFSYDTTLEIYDLTGIEVALSGGVPQFSLIGQVTEGSLVYSRYAAEDYEKMRNNEELVRMSLNEIRKPAKDFFLRKGSRMARSYQIWAMAQLIKNVQINRTENDDLYEIVAGNFTRFRRRPFFVFIIVLLGYFFLRVISVLASLDIVATILDFGFAGVLIFMSVWIVRSIEENNRRFQKVFFDYQLKPDHSVVNSLHPQDERAFVSADDSVQEQTREVASSSGGNSLS